MPTQKKIEAVADLKERIERATLVVGTGYRGLTVKEMQDLRRKLREGGVEVRVVKNTLLRLAAEQAGQAGLSQIIEGPTALAIGYGDVIEASKALTAYSQTAPQAFSLGSAYMDGTVISAAELRELVRIPPRPVLIAQLLGQLQSPLAGLLALLDAPLHELTGLLHSLLSELPGLVEARARQLETA
jgi:large subunit ribosomal protein L10